MDDRYTNLGSRTRALLADGQERTTKGLAAELMNETLGYDATNRGLIWLATRDLSDVAKRGPEVFERVRTKSGSWVQVKRRHWRWGLWGGRNEDAKGYCPHCGGKL